MTVGVLLLAVGGFLAGGAWSVGKQARERGGGAAGVLLTVGLAGCSVVAVGAGVAWMV